MPKPENCKHHIVKKSELPRTRVQWTTTLPSSHEPTVAQHRARRSHPTHATYGLTSTPYEAYIMLCVRRRRNAGPRGNSEISNNMFHTRNREGKNQTSKPLSNVATTSERSKSENWILTLRAGWNQLVWIQLLSLQKHPNSPPQIQKPFISSTNLLK